jgi:glyoxylase-like metal-dependent hydrolase (beta-lactamase superfamily II)
VATGNTFGYSVLVSDPIPLTVGERLPNGEPRMFSPLSSTLIYGENDAVLADPPLTTGQATVVGDWVQASGKKLTRIFATHGHGDHWFTAPVLAERFGAQVVASAGTIKQMHVNASLREAFYDTLVPGIPPSPVTAVTPPGNRLTLEGHELIIIEVGHADTDDSSVLHVPDLGLVVAGDVLYNGVHQWLAESGSAGRDAWRTAIGIVAALEPRWAVAGHKNKTLDDDAARAIAETRQYLHDAEELLRENSTGPGFFNAMLERYPNRLGRDAVWNTARALYGGDHQRAN